MSTDDDRTPRAPPLAPAPPARVLALDVLRGLAILGILPVNLPLFALPRALTDTPHAVSPAPSEAVVEGLLAALVDLKLFTIFALLFGAGLELQAFGLPGRSPASPGPRTREVPRLLRRLALLAGIGVLHGCGLWFGDVLLAYAAAGAVVVVLLATPLRPRALAALGAALIAVPVALCLRQGALAMGAPPSAPGAAPTTVAAALERPDDGAAGDLPGPGREILIHREGSARERLDLRVSIWRRVCESLLASHSWRVLGLMLVGAASVRSGLLPPDARRRRGLARLAVVGLAVGLPMEAACAWSDGLADPSRARAAFTDAAHQVGALVLALGYAALVLLAPAAWLARPPLRWLGAAGRCALSCYLAESVVCVLVFDGLGWFGRLTRVELLAFALAVWALLLLASGLWMRRFAMGPVEWAWRSLADGRARALTAAARSSSAPDPT